MKKYASNMEITCNEKALVLHLQLAWRLKLDKKLDEIDPIRVFSSADVCVSLE